MFVYKTALTNGHLSHETIQKILKIRYNSYILYSLSNIIQDLTLDETSLETPRSFPQCIVRVAILFGAVSLDKLSTKNMSHFIINSVNFMHY